MVSPNRPFHRTGGKRRPPPGELRVGSAYGVANAASHMSGSIKCRKSKGDYSPYISVMILRSWEASEADK
jgi:hypothetical protein